MSDLTPVTLGLGSNIGDKAANIRRAAELLVSEGIVAALEMSSLYRTAPWGPVAQDWFVNACVAGATPLSADDLLKCVKALEARIGRTVTTRWGPRVIDIDILTFGDVELRTARLTLPHKEVARRAFVLVPLAEIRPGLLICGRQVADLAAAVPDPDVVPLEAPPA